MMKSIIAVVEAAKAGLTTRQISELEGSTLARVNQTARALSAEGAIELEEGAVLTPQDSLTLIGALNPVLAAQIVALALNAAAGQEAKPTNQPPHIPYMLVKSIARKRSGWRSTLTDAMVGEMRLQYERLKRHGKAEWGEMRDRVLYLNDAGAMHFAAMLADDDYRSKKTVPTRYPYHMHLKEAMEGSWSNYLYLMRNPEAAQERLE